MPPSTSPLPPPPRGHKVRLLEGALHCHYSLCATLSLFTNLTSPIKQGPEACLPSRGLWEHSGGIFIGCLAFLLQGGKAWGPTVRKSGGNHCYLATAHPVTGLVSEEKMFPLAPGEHPAPLSKLGSSWRGALWGAPIRVPQCGVPFLPRTEACLLSVRAPVWACACVWAWWRGGGWTGCGHSSLVSVTAEASGVTLCFRVEPPRWADCCSEQTSPNYPTWPWFQISYSAL